MKHVTTQLKEIKIMRKAATVLYFPIILPFWILYKLGKFSEVIIDYIRNSYFNFEEYIVKISKLEDKAIKLHKESKLKI